jgi:uncharacterized repeat protein (TIGR03803 family)
VQGFDGNFYGTTFEGGANSAGTVFKITPAGALTTLYNFCSLPGCTDGSFPYAGLLVTSNGDFYGVTSQGGTNLFGTIFEITREGELSTLYNFCSQANCADGSDPQMTLTEANGDLYGTTPSGGAVGSGTVFRFSPSTRQFTSLYSFCSQAGCEDGEDPNAGLALGADGNFYGTTASGGANGLFGTVFRISPTGKLRTLFSFDGPHGSQPSGTMVQGANGDFYGTTQAGGAKSDGTVFQITPAGMLTVLYSFCSQTGCADGTYPNGGLVLATDGNLYGTAVQSGNTRCPAGCGTIFKVTPTGNFTLLYSFCSQNECADGKHPLAGLVQGTNGNFYGATYFSGVSSGPGTIFTLGSGLGSFAEIIPSAGPQGSRVVILGHGFNSSSVVNFDGAQGLAPAPLGKNALTVTPTSGTLTGPFTVTTGSVTLTGNQIFRVLPASLKFNPQSGSPGTSVTITGTGLTQTLKVGFGNAIPANIVVNSDTEITATVPVGAKTGPIGVQTEGGRAVSAQTFTVTP